MTNGRWKPPMNDALDTSDIVAVMTSHLPEFAIGALTVESCTQLWSRRKLRKRLAGYEIVFRGDHASSHRLSLIAKQYPEDRGGRAYLAMCWLEAQGFRSTSTLRVARAVLYDSNDHLLLQEKAPGSELAAALSHQEALVSQARLAARWLAELHACDAAEFRRSRTSAVRSIHARQSALAEAFPRMSERLNSICSDLVERVQGSWRFPAVASHGDYHPKNIFLDGERVTVIDLDHFASREAAADVGYFVGQMAIMARFRTGSFAVAQQPILAFLDEYDSSASDRVPWPRIAGHVSRTFVQSLHYELCVFRNARTDLIDDWLDQSEAWLKSRSADDVVELLMEPARFLARRGRLERVS